MKKEIEAFVVLKGIKKSRRDIIKTRRGIRICCQTRILPRCSRLEKVKECLKNTFKFC